MVMSHLSLRIIGAVAIAVILVGLAIYELAEPNKKRRLLKRLSPVFVIAALILIYTLAAS